MMRRPFTTLTLVTVCGLLTLVAVAALGAKLIRGSGSPSAQTGAALRTYPVELKAAPDDFTLADMSFHPRARQRRPMSSVRVAVNGPFGHDYMAAAVARPTTSRVVHVLVLLVDRPSALLDPASVELQVSARSVLGAPTVHELANLFARTAPAPSARPALCELALGKSGLGAGQLSVVGARGSQLARFDAVGAVAQAYDVACALPFASAFKQAVAPSPPASEPPPASPHPPVGILPGEGCKPAPGYACPG
jgi:hypothetical protein